MHLSIVVVSILSLALSVVSESTYYISTTDSRNPFITNKINPTAKSTAGMLQISNLSWGSATPYSTSTGLVGKVSLGSVTITRPVDANSPKFFGMMASGVSFSRIDILSFPGGSISPATLPSSLGLHLGRALITSINSTWGDDGTITETIVFNYQSIVEVYNVISSTGTISSTITNGWNGQLNTALNTIQAA